MVILEHDSYYFCSILILERVMMNSRRFPFRLRRIFLYEREREREREREKERETLPSASYIIKIMKKDCMYLFTYITAARTSFQVKIIYKSHISFFWRKTDAYSNICVTRTDLSGFRGIMPQISFLRISVTVHPENLNHLLATLDNHTLATHGIWGKNKTWLLP